MVMSYNIDEILPILKPITTVQSMMKVMMRLISVTN